MGQDLRDCHALWKRRVSQKVLFTKLDALGMDKRYSWKLFKAVSGEKFEKVATGTGIYDPKYFGLVASSPSSPMPVASSVPVLLPPKPLTYVEQVAAKYTPRLSGFVSISGTLVVALIEFLDASFHVKERFTSRELQALGWNVILTGYGVELSKEESRIVVRQWPVDPFGKVAANVAADL